MLFPLPFSRVVFLYGAPMLVPREGDTEEWRSRLQTTMNDLADDAERLVNE